jgi:hypothetical protein
MPPCCCWPSSRCGGGKSSVADAQYYANRRDYRQSTDRQSISQHRTCVHTNQLSDQELDIGGGIVIAKPRPDLPMPVGARAVTPPVPNAEAEPGQRRKRHRHKVPYARLPPYPTQAIEKNPCRVKRKEADVKDVVH